MAKQRGANVGVGTMNRIIAESYSQQLHTARQERLKRMGMIPSHKIIPQPKPARKPEPVGIIVRDILDVSEPIELPRLTIADIINVVAGAYGVSVTEMKSERRHQYLTTPRHVGMYLASTLTGRAMTEIGRRFCKDHTTVLHAIRLIKKRMVEDLELSKTISTLETQIRGRFNVVPKQSVGMDASNIATLRQNGTEPPLPGGSFGVGTEPGFAQGERQPSC